MAVIVRRRKRDEVTVFYAKYYAEGRQVTEKVATVPAKARKVEFDRARTKAQAVDHQRRVEVENGTWKHPRERRAARLTFAEVVERFLRDYKPRSGKIRYYSERSKLWLKHLPKTRLARQITVADVDRFRRLRERKVGPSTVRKDLVALSTLFRWAAARDLVTTNPADPDRVRRPPEPTHRAGYLSADEEKRLLEECSTWLRPIVQWGINTGMDREEILRLSWRDIDESAGVVHAPRGKTGISRDLPLNKTLRTILAQAKRVRSIGDGGRVFLDDDGKKIHVQAAKTALRRAYDEAGVHAPPWKTLRHTFASRLAMAGVSMTAVARLMGHSTMAITDRYAHLSPKYLEGAMAVLDGPPASRTSHPTAAHVQT